jgi:hypothetical protein
MHGQIPMLTAALIQSNMIKILLVTFLSLSQQVIIVVGKSFLYHLAGIVCGVLIKRLKCCSYNIYPLDFPSKSFIFLVITGKDCFC